MRSKAPLALLEQILMLLVFALAAVICLRAFLWSDTASRQSTARDEALVHAQSAAEVVKSCRGDLTLAAQMLDGTVEDGALLVQREDYTLRAEKERVNDYLGRAEVTVSAGGDTLASLGVAWQEVSP